MKYLKQFSIILGISLVGEALHHFIPLPVPASIYGMVILFVGLVTGLVKLESVNETGKFLIEIMPIMFVPAAVGLMEDWGVMKGMLLPLVLVTIVALVLVMAVAGWISQLVIRGDGRKKNHE